MGDGGLGSLGAALLLGGLGGGGGGGGFGGGGFGGGKGGGKGGFGGGGGLGGGGAGRGAGEKTGICNFFKEKGHCGYGDACRFRHESGDGGGGGGDDVVSGGKKKKEEGTQFSGKFMDHDGIKEKSFATRVGIIKRKSEAKRLEEMDDDEEFTRTTVICAKDVSQQLKKIAGMTDTDAKEGEDLLKRLKAKKILDTVVEQMEKLNLKGTMQKDAEDQKDDSKVEGFMMLMAKNLEKAEERHTDMMKMLMNGKKEKKGEGGGTRTKDGKFCSPSGKVRKAARKSTSSTASSGSAATTAESKPSGAGGPLCFALFGSDESSDEEDESEDEADVVVKKKVEMDAILAVKDKLESHWKDSGITWENRAADRAFNEAAPLEGFQGICGPNTSLATKQVKVKELGGYLANYPLGLLTAAEGHTKDLTVLWKHYKQPGRKMDLVVKTYGLEITGTAKPERKPLLLLLAILYAAKIAGIPTIDPETAEF